MRKSIQVSIILMVLVISFQNCTKSFQVDESGSLVASGDSNTNLSTDAVLTWTDFKDFTNTSTLSFSFNISYVDNDFVKSAQCSLNNSQSKDCTQGSVSFDNLADGIYPLKVVIESSKGRRAEKIRYFTKDMIAPVVSVASQPSLTSSQSAGSLVFSIVDSLSGAAGAVCSKDKNPFEPCQSPWVLTDLANGSHTVHIKSTDKAGNDSNVYSYTWTVSLSTVPVSVAPDVEMVFPPPAGSTVDSHMIVRGRSKDGVNISNLKVNGILATTSDQFKTWRVDVPLAMGVNLLSVDAQVNTQPKTELAVSTITRVSSETGFRRGTGTEWDMRPLGLAYEPVKNRYIVAVDGEDGIMGVSSATGDRIFISDSEGDKIGDGYEIVQPRSGVAYGNSSFVIDNNLLVLIDTVSGYRSIFATLLTETNQPASLASIALSADAKSVFAISYMTDSVLYKADTSTAAVSIVSSKTKGTGVELRNAGTLGYSSQLHTAFVSIRYSDTILAVDAATGNRRIFSQGTTGEPKFQDPEYIVADDKNGAVYVWDSGKLHVLDMQTGRRRSVVTSGSFASFNDIYGMTLTPSGPAILDYIPDYVTNRPQRGKTLMVIDPVEGTRVAVSR